MKYLSLFSGIGGFELGIQNAYRSTLGGKQTDTQRDEGQRLLTEERKDTSTKNGWTSERSADESNQRPLCVGYSEIDKYAIKVYERQFNGDRLHNKKQEEGLPSIQPEGDSTSTPSEVGHPQDNKHRNYGDCTTINPTELPDFDLLVGGFPCQAFSIAGKRHGFNDTRGTLFFDIARILAEKRPGHLVLENVKGLLSHDGGKTLQTILGVLADLGYRVEWQVLNSKDFGVPQNRERIYIIGHLGGECGRQVFPITGNRTEIIEQGLVTVSAVTGVKDVQLSPTLDTMYKKGLGSKQARPAVLKQLIGGSQGNRVYDVDGISSTIASQAGGMGAKTGLYAMRGRENGQQLEPSGDFTNTITSVAKDNLWLEDYKIRRLTPRECERLQGFPDDWTAGESDTQRYKMCGNAVTVNVVEAVMSKLIKCL